MDTDALDEHTLAGNGARGVALLVERERTRGKPIVELLQSSEKRLQQTSSLPPSPPPSLLTFLFSAVLSFLST